MIVCLLSPTLGDVRFPEFTRGDGGGRPVGVDMASLSSIVTVMCGCRVWIRLEKNIYEEGIEVLLKSRLG